jgi:hypothetical protein
VREPSCAFYGKVGEVGLVAGVERMGNVAALRRWYAKDLREKD